MSTEEGIRIGLEAAARHLETEAAECEKKAVRLREIFGSDNRVAALMEHVNLLRHMGAQLRILRVRRDR